MTRQEVTDEMLMAFADGELDDTEMARIAGAIDADPALAARVDAFLQSRALSKAALGPLLAEPVPKALEDAVRRMAETAQRSGSAGEAQPEKRADNNVLVMRRPTPAEPVAMRVGWPMALAASLTLVLAGAGGYLAGMNSPGNTAPGELAVLSDPAVVDALNAAPSGERSALADGGEVRLVSSFRDSGGTLCREFEARPAAGPAFVSVACRADDRGWQSRLIVALERADGGFAPASSVEAVDAWMESTAAGAPLEPAAEADALRE